MLTETQRDEKRRLAEALLAALPLPEAEAGWARDARAAARARLLDAGAPIRRDEYWKYTDPSALTAPQAPPTPVNPAVVPEPPAGIDAPRIAFVDGRLRTDLSAPFPTEGLTIASLSAVLSRDITWARELFGTLEAAGQEKVLRPLASLNTAAATEGLAIHVTGPVADPICLAFASSGAGGALCRQAIRVETGGDLTLIEIGVPGNSALEVDVAPGGAFRHIRIQDDPGQPSAAHVFARIAEGAVFKSFTLTSNGALTRNESVIEFVGDDGIGHIAGAILARGDSHTDNTVFVTHGAERCESRQVFKQVLDGAARAIFQGKIFVRKGAQKTDGYQISQAVLLSDGAEFSVKPELEIYADDVKCSHGSTTGALDRTALFYLMSRGVPRREAEALLIASFVAEAIEEIDRTDLQEVMLGYVADWMRARA